MPRWWTRWAQNGGAKRLSPQSTSPDATRSTVPKTVIAPQKASEEPKRYAPELVKIITLDKSGSPYASNVLEKLLDKQMYPDNDPFNPCDSQVPLSVQRDGFLYEVETASVELVRHMPVVYLEIGAHLSIALTYKIDCQESFKEMTGVWQSAIGSVAEMQQQPLPLTVLVVGFRLGDAQDNTQATRPSADPDDAKEECGEMFARTNGYLYAQCDCRTGQGVREAFTRVAEDAHAVGRIRFAGDPEGLRSYRDQAKIACYRLIRACP